MKKRNKKMTLQPRKKSQLQTIRNAKEIDSKEKREISKGTAKKETLSVGTLTKKETLSVGTLTKKETLSVGTLTKMTRKKNSYSNTKKGDPAKDKKPEEKKAKVVKVETEVVTPVKTAKLEASEIGSKDIWNEATLEDLISGK